MKRVEELEAKFKNDVVKISLYDALELAKVKDKPLEDAKTKLSWKSKTR